MLENIRIENAIENNIFVYADVKNDDKIKSIIVKFKYNKVATVSVKTHKDRINSYTWNGGSNHKMPLKYRKYVEYILKNVEF